MPKNKKEGIFFTTFMCLLMVLGMSIYNLALYRELTVKNVALGLIPGFLVAFLLDVFVVGVVAKKAAFSLPFVKPENPIRTILTISGFMVIGMVSFMSLYGMVMGGSTINLANYFTTWGFNFIVALPYQILVVGPLARYSLKKLF